MVLKNDLLYAFWNADKLKNIYSFLFYRFSWYHNLFSVSSGILYVYVYVHVYIIKSILLILNLYKLDKEKMEIMDNRLKLSRSKQKPEAIKNTESFNEEYLTPFSNLTRQ